MLLHVHPSRDGGRWLVDAPDGRSALSSHRTASEAERAARRHAATCGARSICVHDAYHRVRTVNTTGTQGADSSAARIASSPA
jgi:hypothetical protein